MRGKDRKRFRIKLNQLEGCSDFKVDSYGGLVGPQLSMKQYIQFYFNEEEHQLVEDSDLEVLMKVYLELHDQSLIYGYKITKLLKKERKDGGKMKMTNESATLKQNCVVDKEASEKERKVVKEDKVELEKKLKSWKNRYLDLKKNG